MAEVATEVRMAPSWMYVNELRLVTVVLGAAIVVLGIGLLVFLVDGPEQMDTVDVFLGTGVFFILFTVFLFVPRLRSRGAISFTLLVEHSMDEVEIAVTEALQASGRVAHVEVQKSRFQRPPREVVIDGLTWRFSLRAAPYRESRAEGTPWTEIVQTGLQKEEDEVARDLRERVLSRLATSDSVQS